GVLTLPHLRQGLLETTLSVFGLVIVARLPKTLLVKGFWQVQSTGFDRWHKGIHGKGVPEPGSLTPCPVAYCRGTGRRVRETSSEFSSRKGKTHGAGNQPQRRRADRAEQPVPHVEHAVEVAGKAVVRSEDQSRGGRSGGAGDLGAATGSDRRPASGD